MGGGGRCVNRAAGSPPRCLPGAVCTQFSWVGAGTQAALAHAAYSAWVSARWEPSCWPRGVTVHGSEQWLTSRISAGCSLEPLPVFYWVITLLLACRAVTSFTYTLFIGSKNSNIFPFHF